MAANATRTGLMHIGELARQTGVSIKALRFYDRLGLLLVAGRSPANYRLFGEEAVACVECIRAMHAAGLTLRDLRELSAAQRAGHDIRASLLCKLEEVLGRLDQQAARLRLARVRLLALRADVEAFTRGRTA